MASDLDAKVKELEAKVQELYDREAVRELRYRYHEYINEGKFDRIHELFAEDGEIDFAHLGKGKGHEEITRFYSAINAKPSAVDKSRLRITWVKQFIHNHIVHLRGNTGSGISYMEAKPVFNGESFLVAARIDDEYVKQNGQWKLKKMTLVPYFMVPLKEGWAQEDLLKMRPH